MKRKQNGVLMVPPRINHVSIRPMEWLWAVLIVFVIVAAVDILTNSLDLNQFDGDFIYYIDMAENGILANDHLAAPFAYRPVTPFLASGISNIVGMSLETGFHIVAWIGAFLTLLGSYALARIVGANHRQAILIIMTIAGSFYHLKYLLFDVYRPDHLAYGLLIIAFIALLYKRWGILWVVSAIGLSTREFCVIPLILALLQQLLSLLRGTDNKMLVLIRLVVGGIVILGFAILPRVLLPVETTFVYAELFKADPSFLDTITVPLFSLRRNFNLLFALLAYSLPLMWLGNRHQFRLMWQQLGEIRWMVAGYTLLVLLLALIGGTDIARFVTYLYIPLIIFMALLLQQNLPSFLLIGMIASQLIFNRIPFLIPQDDYNQFVDFYGAYHDRINMNVIARWQELVVFLFLAIGLYGGFTIVKRQRSAADQGLK